MRRIKQDKTTWICRDIPFILFIHLEAATIPWILNESDKKKGKEKDFVDEKVVLQQGMSFPLFKFVILFF